MATTSKRAPRASDDDVEAAFDELVNMTPRALEAWLKTDASREAGFKGEGGGESTGHRSGRHIVELLREKKSEYDERDRAEMRRVVGYIKRHLAQRPAGDTRDTRWAHSLKNWGHDPNGARAPRHRSTK